jgi:hypothetical protein
MTENICSAPSHTTQDCSDLYVAIFPLINRHTSKLHAIRPSALVFSIHGQPSFSHSSQMHPHKSSIIVINLDPPTHPPQSPHRILRQSTVCSGSLGNNPRSTSRQHTTTSQNHLHPNNEFPIIMSQHEIADSDNLANIPSHTTL